MKLLFDLFPAILFFVVYLIVDPPERIYAATAAAMVGSLIQIIWSWLKHRKVDRMLWVVFAILMVMGGLTLALRDPSFIKWKPTIVSWATAVVFLGADYLFGKNLFITMMGAQMRLPLHVWRRINVAWAVFSVLLGFLNLYVAYNFSENVWVNFKVFGLALLSFLFMFGMFMLASKHMIDEPGDPADPPPSEPNQGKP